MEPLPSGGADRLLTERSAQDPNGGVTSLAPHRPRFDLGRADRRGQPTLAKNRKATLTGEPVERRLHDFGELLVALTDDDLVLSRLGPVLR